MTIHIRRIDPLADIPDTQKTGVLSDDFFGSWENAIGFLRAHNLTITDSTEAQFRAWPTNDLCTFQNNEFVEAPNAAYACRVQYELLVTDNAKGTP